MLMSASEALSASMKVCEASPSFHNEENEQDGMAALGKIQSVMDAIGVKIEKATVGGFFEVTHHFTFDENTELLDFVGGSVHNRLANAGYTVKDITRTPFEVELEISW